MFDFHSHILPCIDDGSKSISQTEEMLSLLSEQGVKHVCATPHFNANRHSVSEFKEIRENAFQSIKDLPICSRMSIHPGAEVSYYDGISRLDGLFSLCIEGCNILLIEMPFMKWSDYTVDEIIHLACSGEMRIALAHIERYLKFQGLEVFERLAESDVLLQANSSFFTQFSTKRKALHMLKNGYINLIGSDCHNLTTRPPNIKAAYDMIENKMGEAHFNKMNCYWSHLFKQIN